MKSGPKLKASRQLRRKFHSRPSNAFWNSINISSLGKFSLRVKSITPPWLLLLSLYFPSDQCFQPNLNLSVSFWHTFAAWLGEASFVFCIFPCWRVSLLYLFGLAFPNWYHLMFWLWIPWSKTLLVSVILQLWWLLKLTSVPLASPWHSYQPISKVMAQFQSRGYKQ